MSVTITPEHNVARLAGSLAFLDTGASNAKVRLYEGTRPPLASSAPTGSTMLVEITLTKPSGTMANGTLTLTQLENGLIAATGIAQWARFVNGDGNTAFDCDVDNGSNNGEVIMAQTQLFAGGEARLVSTTLG